jgi:hypothetical protein
MSNHSTDTTEDRPIRSSLRRQRDRASLDRAATAPRCVHVKLNGIRCGSPALRRDAYCYFHHRWLNQPDEDTFPPFEDGNSVQFALMQIVERLRREAFRGGTVDPRMVKPLIFAVKTAAQNLRNTAFDPAQEQSLIVDPIDIAADDDQQVALAPQTFNPPPRPEPDVSPQPAKKQPHSASTGPNGLDVSTGD